MTSTMEAAVQVEHDYLGYLMSPDTLTCTEILPTSFSSMSESKFLSLSDLSCICEDMSTDKVWKSHI